MCIVDKCTVQLPRVSSVYMDSGQQFPDQDHHLAVESMRVRYPCSCFTSPLLRFNAINISVFFEVERNEDHYKCHAGTDLDIEKNMFLAFDILSSIVCHWYQTGYPLLVLGLIIANILNPHRTKKIDLGLELLQEDFEKRYNMDLENSMAKLLLKISSQEHETTIQYILQVSHFKKLFPSLCCIIQLTVKIN